MSGTCAHCGHDMQEHYRARVISTGAISTTPLCTECKCGHSQRPRVK